MGQRWQQRAKRRHSKPLRQKFSEVSFLEALHIKHTESTDFREFVPRHPVRSDMILLPGGNIRRAWDCLGLFLLFLVLVLQVM
jgi:hypothetical protein